MPQAQRPRQNILKLSGAEAIRLEEDERREKHWKRWGPYLSERAWGTVREDYSPYGTAWEYLPHDHARSKAYRWNEDGLAGISDRHQLICFALALWNGRDPILKERAFGLTGNEGNHGEDVNWRGPIWFPVNFLLIESLQKFHHYLGDDFTVECPTGSGQRMTLWEVAEDLSRRLARIFLRGPDGRRPVYGGAEKFQQDPHWRDHILFYEFFHGDNGAGIGASHQTGWTGLIAKLLQQSGDWADEPSDGPEGLKAGSRNGRTRKRVDRS